MTFPRRRLTLLLILCALLCLAVAPAPALAIDVAVQQFTLFQDGYSEGATMTGTFAGSDLDGNGILVHFPLQDGGPVTSFEHLELTAFSLHFSGNSLSPAFDLALTDLFGFVYQLGTNDIGDDPAFDPTLDQDLTEGIGAIGSMRFFTSGLGPNGFFGGYVGGQISLPGPPNSFEDEALDSSPNLVQVTLVPEPSAGIIAMGLILLAGSGRRRD